MNKIWFTSDLHFCHDREFIYGPRGFINVAEMNAAIIDNFNHMVDDGDDLYILGDLMLKDDALGMKCLNSLPGRKHIIIGNHDTLNRQLQYHDMRGFDEMHHANILKYQGYHFFLCHYPTLTGNLERESLKQVTCNLFGHTHQKTNFYQDIPYMYHVGVDSHDCKPVLLDDIINEMEAKVKECKEMS